jgi:thiol:disulfide interchange protein
MHLIRRLPDSGALTMPMHKFLRRAIAAASLCVLAASVAVAKHTKTAGPSSKEASTYDEARDPAKDLQAAIAQAQKAHKRILLEVGGDWCMYCNIMDETFDGHPNLIRVRDNNYITLKVNYSPGNHNEAFLSKYPKIADYPQFFVLDSDGSLLHTQSMRPFEHGNRFNASKIEEFLNKWSHPPARLFNLKKTSDN